MVVVVLLLLLLLLLVVVLFVRSVCGDSTVAFLFMAVQSAVFPWYWNPFASYRLHQHTKNRSSDTFCCERSEGQGSKRRCELFGDFLW